MQQCYRCSAGTLFFLTENLCLTLTQGEAIAAAKRERGEGGAKRNMSGTAYNILTLDYSNTPNGEALKHRVSGRVVR